MSSGLTERQQKWFASVRESLAIKTGKSLEEWVAVMAACPETAPRARLKWLKDNYGVGQNYGSMILDALIRRMRWAGTNRRPCAQPCGRMQQR